MLFYREHAYKSARFPQSKQIRSYCLIWLNLNSTVTHCPVPCHMHHTPLSYSHFVSLSVTQHAYIHRHTHKCKLLYRKNQPSLAINQPEDILSWCSNISQSQSHHTAWEPDNMLCVCVPVILFALDYAGLFLTRTKGLQSNPRHPIVEWALSSQQAGCWGGAAEGHTLSTKGFLWQFHARFTQSLCSN